MQQFKAEHLQSFYDEIGKIAETMLSERMDDDCSQPSEFDCYRSLAHSRLVILVAKDIVPPFRFRAGGWELLQSLTEIEPAITIRIAEKGFFMLRADEDGPGWIEQADIPVHALEDN